MKKKRAKKPWRHQKTKQKALNCFITIEQIHLDTSFLHSFIYFWWAKASKIILRWTLFQTIFLNYDEIILKILLLPSICSRFHFAVDIISIQMAKMKFLFFVRNGRWKLIVHVIVHTHIHTTSKQIIVKEEEESQCSVRKWIKFEF